MQSILTKQKHPTCRSNTNVNTPNAQPVQNYSYQRNTRIAIQYIGPNDRLIALLTVKVWQ